jgi:hypothetical protein
MNVLLQTLPVGFGSAIDIAVSSATSRLNLSLDLSVTVYSAVGSIFWGVMSAVVSRIAPPMPTIPFLSDVKVAMIIALLFSRVWIVSKAFWQSSSTLILFSHGAIRYATIVSIS